MTVVDVSGRRLGRVARVQLAAPPVTHPPDSDLIDDMAEVVPAPPEMAEASAQMDVIGPSPLGHDPLELPDLPEALRAHLEEVGFCEIEPEAELPDVGRFIPADHLEDVRADRVVARPWP